MADPTNFQRATESLHRSLTATGLEETVIRMRDSGDSWRTLAAKLGATLELDLTDQTLRRWYPDVVAAEQREKERRAAEVTS